MQDILMRLPRPAFDRHTAYSVAALLITSLVAFQFLGSALVKTFAQVAAAV